MGERLSRRGEGTTGGAKDYSEQRTSVYFKGNTLEQIRQTAAMMDRSVGFVLARAYNIAREQLESEARAALAVSGSDEGTTDTDLGSNA